jgi:chloramphenicol-sensitive protein RarD
MSAVEAEKEPLRNGFIAAVVAYSIWGFLPLYFMLVNSVPPLELLAYRIAWAVPFGALILFFRRQFPDVKRALTDKRTFLLLLASASFVSFNWFLYIVAIQRNEVFQASLGYYITPMMYMIAGVLLFGERMRRLQVMAALLAALGVLYLTFSGGDFPLIAVALAVSFTIYGVIRKQVVVGAMPGLFIETLLMFPLAVIYLAWLWNHNAAMVSSVNDPMTLMLSLSGPLTVLPLLCFAIAARRLQLTTIGMMQFTAPSLNFGIAVYYGEELTAAHIICFTCIWIAMSLFVGDAWRQSRRIKSLRNASTAEA